MTCILLFALQAVSAGEEGEAKYRLSDVRVVVPGGSGETEPLAAQELCRYLYLLTGVRRPVGNAIPSDRPTVLLRTGTMEGADPSQTFSIAVLRKSPALIEVRGGSPAATLWGAYTLIESWGVGFYLGGDLLPPVDPKREGITVSAVYRPAFSIRGTLPWFNFLNSPTTWNPQDYRTFFAQLAKQKANLVAFHAYDHEPFCSFDGSAQPLMTTVSPHRWWSPPVMSTRDFLFGTDQWFHRGEWGCEIGIESAWAYDAEAAIRLQRKMLADALAYARRLGLRTCLGFEASGDPDDLAVRRHLERRIRDVLATYPLDYLAIWQSEGRGTGSGIAQGIKVDDDVRSAFSYLSSEPELGEAARITKFVRLAHAAIRRFAPKVRLVVSGWGGDRHMRFTSLYPGLDRVVPDDVVFSALDNIDPSAAPAASEAYAEVRPGRECWPVLWFESDAVGTRMDQTGPQTNVTPFHPLLQDLLAKKCAGVLGIHWRTRNVEDVAGYALRFAWRSDLTPTEYFRIYSADHYGPKLANEMSKIHLRLEELGPQYVGSPGCIECYTPFAWFATRRPDTNRFSELEAMMSRLEVLDHTSSGGAKRELHDLRQTIRWLLARTRVGLAIWGEDAPLERALREAEESRSAAAAAKVLRDLEKLDFRGGMQALAVTCRTRGELGMLATANARYGRAYASFLARIEAIMAEPLAENRSGLPPPGLVVFPVPNWIPADRTVTFDAVAPGAARAWVRIGEREIPMRRLGGSCFRAVFVPQGIGEIAWRIRLEGSDLRFPEEGEPDRLLTIGPALGTVVPSYVRAPHDEPVFSLHFSNCNPMEGSLLGSAKVSADGLDLRSGGQLKIAEADADLSESFTLVVRVCAESWEKKRWPVIVSKGRWAGSGYFLQLYGDTLRFGFGDGRTLDGGTLPVGRWAQVAVVFDGRRLRTLVDGEEVASLHTGQGSSVSNEPLRIGAYNEPGTFDEHPFRGQVSRFEIYDRALLPDELIKLKGR